MTDIAAGPIRTAVFAPLGDLSRSGRVERRLADAIRTGLLRDGERLPSEVDLATALGVATVTAREALAALRSRGLVSTTRGRGGGSFVRRPEGVEETAALERLRAVSRVDLHDQAAHYALVVAGAAELAAERATPAEARGLEELLLPPDEVDPARWRHADTEMTLSLAGLTQSARLTRAVMRLEADTGLLLRLPFDEPPVRDATRAYHHALVDAVVSADPGRARALVRSQLDSLVAALARRHARLH